MGVGRIVISGGGRMFDSKNFKEYYRKYFYTFLVKMKRDTIRKIRDNKNKSLEMPKMETHCEQDEKSLKIGGRKVLKAIAAEEVTEVADTKEVPSEEEKKPWLVEEDIQSQEEKAMDLAVVASEGTQEAVILEGDTVQEALDSAGTLEVVI